MSRLLKVFQFTNWRFLKLPNKLMIKSHAKNGLLSSNKILKIREEMQLGNSTLMLFGLICKLNNLMLLAGTNITVSGQEMHSQFSLSNPDGFILLQTLFLSITSFLDSKDNSQDISPLGLMDTTLH
jgi:hypothetical protein